MMPEPETPVTPLSPPLPANTTQQQDITTAAQRRINVIWETTQALIALLVVAANISVQVFIVVTLSRAPVPESLSNVLFLVVGFYFSRTNHAAIGGIGMKPVQQYEGR